MKNSILVRVQFISLLALILIVPAFVIGQTPTAEQRVATFKQSLAKDQAALKKYEWIETTTVSMKGEVKSVKQNRCFYGADGKVQKVPIAQPAAPADSGGRGGRIKQRVVENKKEELTEYMQKAVALVHQYVPPDPNLIKYEKDTNNVKVEPVNQNGVVRLSFPNFIKSGDLLSATLDGAANKIVDVNVATYLDSPQDAITLAVVFAQLADGTGYSGKTTLNAPSQKIVVVVENSGYKPM